MLVNSLFNQITPSRLKGSVVLSDIITRDSIALTSFKTEHGSRTEGKNCLRVDAYLNLAIQSKLKMKTALYWPTS